MTTQIVKTTGSAVEVIKSSEALEATVKGEIDTQIKTAKTFPRDVDLSLDRIRSLALRPEVAKEVNYAIPRAGKINEGPSIRFAEIIGSSWGNLRAGARIVAMDAFGVTCQGVAHDLETNFAVTRDIVRRYPVKPGNKPTADMEQLTAMQCAAIALRDAILTVVPKPLWAPILEEAKKIARGTPQTFETRYAAALKHFGKMGVNEAQILAKLNRASVKQCQLEDLDLLQGFAVAINDGTSPEEIFGPATLPIKPPSAKPNVGGEKTRKTVLSKAIMERVAKLESEGKSVKLSPDWEQLSADELEALYGELS